jgi:N-acetylglucosamine-6-sulfatase
VEAVALTRILPVALVTAALVSGCGSGHPSAKKRVQPGPNIVVIETDDQDAASVAHMPKVQALLAAQGTTFENSFVSDSLCCPSRATFLTGQYAHNHHVLSNNPPDGGYRRLRASNALPVWLKRVGYRTILVGKYLNGFGGGAGGKKPLPPRPPGWSAFFAVLDPTQRYFDFPVDDNGVVRRFSGQDSYQTDLLADTAVRSIRRAASLHKPFMLWFTPAAPHDPATPAPRDDGKTHDEPVPDPPSLNEADVQDKPSFIRSLPLLKPMQLTKREGRYRRRLATLLGVDDAVAKIVDALSATGQLAKTVIVFTSDNGWVLGEHRIPAGKRVPYEESIRVPLIVRGPGFARGVKRAAPVANIDLAPTIAALAHARAGVDVDGCSLLPLAAHARAHWQRNLLFENLTTNGLGGETDKVKDLPKYAAIRSGQFMWVEYANGERELYDLASDPYELSNRAADPGLADVRARLSARLARLRKGPAPACKLVSD